MLERKSNGSLYNFTTSVKLTVCDHFLGIYIYTHTYIAILISILNKNSIIKRVAKGKYKLSKWAQLTVSTQSK